jgi:molybdate/tungstate transport system substrate-binding protein
MKGASMLRQIFAGAVLLLVASLPAVAQTPGTVQVLYAGSLVTPMEGPIKDALHAQGITFQGEPGGSKKLANMISGGLRNPDVFVSVDPKLVTGLGARVASAQTFAGTSLGIGWSDKSKYASLFADVAAGKKPLVDALETPGLLIGRTDPKLDPKGEYTVTGMTMLAGPVTEKRILGDDENSSQIFPEEDLLARIDTGQADVGFFYRTEAVARGLHFYALPGAASLTDKITYTLAIMKGAPHPDQAKAFQTFILTGQGKTILQAAGVTYLDQPTQVVP